MSGSLDPRDPFFPQTITTGPRPGNEAVFDNVVRGGLSIRESIALELLAALMANPAMAGVKSGSTLNEVAFRQADLFIARANTPQTLAEVPALD